MKKIYSENIAFKVFSTVDSSTSITKILDATTGANKTDTFCFEKKFVCMSKQVWKNNVDIDQTHKNVIKNQ